MHISIFIYMYLCMYLCTPRLDGRLLCGMLPMQRVHHRVNPNLLILPVGTSCASSTCISIYFCIRTYTHICMHLIYACVYVYMYMYSYVYRVNLRLFLLSLPLGTSCASSTCIYIHLCIRTYTHICV